MDYRFSVMAFEVAGNACLGVRANNEETERFYASPLGKEVIHNWARIMEEAAIPFIRTGSFSLKAWGMGAADMLPEVLRECMDKDLIDRGSVEVTYDPPPPCFKPIRKEDLN